MSIEQTISEDIKDALKSGHKIKVSMLRMIKSAIKNREIEKGGPLTDDDVQAILRSYVKRAKESIEQYSNAGRTDLVDKETEELSIIQGYLPEQLSEDEARELIRGVIEETGASGARDMGKVMKAVMAKTKGQVDGRTANKLVKEMLEA